MNNLPNIKPIETVDSQSADKLAIFQVLERRLLAHGIITENDGKQEFDLDTLHQLKISGSFLNNPIHKNGLKKSYITGQYMLDFFRDKHGAAKDNNEKGQTINGDNEFKTKEDKPFFSLPEDIKKAKSGEFEDGLINPWDLMYQPDFHGKIKLNSGEEATLADLFYLKKLKELQFQRDENDALNYFNKDTQKYEKFYSGQCDKIFGRDISFKENGVLHGLTTSPELFIKKYLPLVDSLNIFKSNDFKRLSGTRAADVLFASDKKLSTKPQYYGSVTQDRAFVQYYLGRGKLFGTDLKVEDNMFTRELSSDLVAILKTEHGRKKILYTFNKLSPEEYDEKGFSNLREEDRRIGGEEMKARIKEYKVSDYLLRHVEETPEDYANRLASLNDINFVTDKFRSITAKAEIPLRNLTWAEQLAIANYSLEGNKEEKLVSFASKYGVEGLRAFLAVESDRSAGRRILEIGEKLPEQAAKIFSKISNLNTLANYEAKDLVDTFLKDSANPEATLKIHGDLLNKSNNILSKFDDILNSNNKKKEKSIELLVKELESKQIENSILVSILKSVKESGQNISLEMIRDLNLEKRVINSKGGVVLNIDEKNQLIDIAKENYQAIFLQKDSNYNPEAYQRVIADYEKELENLDGQSVYILKYKNEIVCSNRFKNISEYAVYGGSFNVSKEIQGLSLGGSFNDKVLEDVSQNYDIQISSRKDNPANNSYQRAGFEIVGEHKEKDGVEYYEMIKPAKPAIAKAA